MAVGYNNVDVNAANKYGVAVGNTPVSFIFDVFFFFFLHEIVLHDTTNFNFQGSFI